MEFGRFLMCQLADYTKKIRTLPNRCNMYEVKVLPEALKGGNDVTYSRHITAHDRIIYDIYDNTLVVLVIDTVGHYSDK